MKHSLFTLLIFFCILVSCRQEIDTKVDNKEHVYINKAKELIELSSKKRLESELKEKWLNNWANAQVLVEENGDQIVAVPSQNTLVTQNNDKIKIQSYILIKFRDESYIGQEILHILKEEALDIPLETLVKGRNKVAIGDFSGSILKQRGDGKGVIIGNRYKKGKRIGVVSFNYKSENRITNSYRLAGDCWDWYYRFYQNGILVYEEYLGTSCDQDSAPPSESNGDIGGGGVGGGPSTEIISNTLTDPCYKATLDDLLNNNNKLHIVLQDILPNFNSNENLSLSITQESSGPAGEDGSFQPRGMVGNAKKYQITLNDNALSGAGKEYIAVTILHEVLHAYFHASNIDVNHHNNMANLYVNPMAQSLANLYGIPLNIATALAWGGLYQTDAWNNLSAGDKSFNLTANNLWRNRGNPRSTAPGTKCN